MSQNMDKQSKSDALKIANKELVFQNGEKEKRAAELIIVNKEKQYHALIENGNDAIVIFNLEGKPTYVSRSIKRVLGYSEEEAMQLGIYKIAHPDDREALSNKMAECLGKPGMCIEGHVCRIKHKNGSWKWLEATITNMLHDPAINGIVDNFRDITERKLIENDLIESREEMETVFNASLDTIIIIDEEGKITKWDSKAELLFGWKEEEVIGTLLSDNIIPPDLREAHHQGMKHFLKTGQGPLLNKTIEVKALKKDKTEINISLSICPSRVKNKYQFIGFIRDISERKVVEEALQKSEANLQAIFENTSDGFILTDINGIIKSFNSKARDRTRLNIEKEINIGISIFDFLPDSRKKMYKNNILKILSGKILQYDYSYTRKSGETKWFSFTINPVYNAEKIEGICITSTDITERKKADEMLQRSEQRYREIAHEMQQESTRLIEAQAVAKVGSWETDIKTLNAKWSEETYRIFETDPEKFEATHLGFLNFIHPDDRAKVDAAFMESLNKTIPNSIEYRIITTTGGEKFVIENWKVFQDGEGHPVRAMGTCQDITDRKLAEQKLAESEKNLHHVLSSASDSFYVINRKGYVTLINKTASENMEKAWGKPVTVGTNILNLIPSEIDEPIRSSLVKVFAGETVEYELHLSIKNLPAWRQVNYSPVKDDMGAIVCAYIVTKNITEKKLAEEIIRESNERYELVTKATSDMVWDWNLLTGKVYRNKEGWKKIFKSDLDNSIGDEEVWQLKIHPEDKERVKQIIQKIINSTDKNFFEIECRMLRNDKSCVFIHDKGYIMRNEEGRAIRLVGTTQDITERKKADEMLQRSEQRYRAIADEKQQESARLIEAQAVAKVGSWETDLQTFSVIWSGETHHIFETDPETFNATHAAFLSFIHPDDLSKVNTAFENSLTSQTVNSIEHRIIATNGTEKHILENWEIFRDAQGHPVRASGTCKDITERKIAENKLKATSIELATAVTDLNKILDSSLDVICTINGNGEFVTVSAASQQVWGYTPEELIGTRFMNLEYHEDVERTSIAVEKIDNNIQVPTFENRYLHKSGRIVHILWSVNWDEKLKLMFCVAKDVTEKKNLEDLLEKSNRLARIGNWEVDLVNNTIYWSDITKQIHEVSSDFVPDLATGINFYKAGSSRETISNSINEAIENTTPFDWELQIVTAKGNERWIRAIGEAECIDGKCIRLFGSFQDIDARKKAEIETLKAYEEKNIILESIGDAFFAVDKEWTVTYWNKEAEKMLLVPRNKIIGINLWEIFSDSIDSVSYKKYHEAIEKNEVINFEDYYPARDKWFGFSAYPSVTGLSVFFKDITDRKLSDLQLTALNLKLTKHADDLATSNRELEDFAYVASHDLQEPLRMVTGFLGQIEKKYSDIIDDKGKQYIHFATDGAKRMRQIILDLLEFSRVGKVEEKEENIDLNKVVNEVILLSKKKVKETNAIINIEDLPSLLICKTPLRQVFQNLISNALKYHKKNQPPVITISAEEASTYWQFAIKDNGIGIEEEYFNKIFIIFQRLHNKDEYTGTGIGLAVCKKIIENFGGKIWLASEENKGSTFYFTIPKK